MSCTCLYVHLPVHCDVATVWPIYEFTPVMISIPISLLVPLPQPVSQLCSNIPRSSSRCCINSAHNILSNIVGCSFLYVYLDVLSPILVPSTYHVSTRFPSPVANSNSQYTSRCMRTIFILHRGIATSVDFHSYLHQKYIVKLLFDHPREPS